MTPVPPQVNAVVLTHMRRHLAGQVVRSLIEDEGFTSKQIIVVVNGSGGLDDPALEDAVRMVHLKENLGPAGGFSAGIEEAFKDPSVEWAYLCEDDVGQMSLPTPRINRLLERIEQVSKVLSPVGAVVAYGSVFQGRTGHTVNFVPERSSEIDLDECDLAAWGATLLSRRVISAGVWPDPDWFFVFEDYDFFCRMRRAGFSLLVDSEAARVVAPLQKLKLEGHLDVAKETGANGTTEAWRAYYLARNYFLLARRHGTRFWTIAHLAYSARRMQLAPNNAERTAILHGLVDGALGRSGKNPKYERTSVQHEGPGSDN
jgi:Glycosyl transferase family 2